MTANLIIDGSHGEGGGQILRSTLSLSVITGRPVRIENLRANRKKPGLAAQHITSVRAAAMLCDAEMKGAELGSQTLQFIPRKPVRAGDYFLDVAEAREGGSAGAVMLVLQTLLPPLALAEAIFRYGGGFSHHRMPKCWTTKSCRPIRLFFCQSRPFNCGP